MRISDWSSDVCSSVSPEELAGTNWRFVSVGGVPVAQDRPTSLAFDGAKLSGSAGCNRFSGGYESDGRTLHAGPLMATQSEARRVGKVWDRTGKYCGSANY